MAAAIFRDVTQDLRDLLETHRWQIKYYLAPKHRKRKSGAKAPHINIHVYNVMYNIWRCSTVMPQIKAGAGAPQATSSAEALRNKIWRQSSNTML